MSVPEIGVNAAASYCLSAGEHMALLQRQRRHRLVTIALRELRSATPNVKAAVVDPSKSYSLFEDKEYEEGDGLYRLRLGDLLNKGSNLYQNFVKVLALEWGVPHGSFNFFIKADGRNRSLFQVRFASGFENYVRLDYLLGSAYQEAHIALQNKGEVLSAQQHFYGMLDHNFKNWRTVAEEMLRNKSKMQKQIAYNGRIALPLSPRLTGAVTGPETLFMDAKFIIEALSIFHLDLWEYHVTVGQSAQGDGMYLHIDTNFG